MPLATRAAPPVAVRRWLVGVCLSLLVVAGCSGGSGSGEEPESVAQSETESASPTTPSPSPTTEPWEKRTKAGAVAFVKHWVDVFNEAGASGDTSELRKISAERCESCENFADFIDRMYAGDGFYRSEGWTVSQVAVVDASIGNRMEIIVRVDAAAERYRESSGEPVQSRAASAATYSAEVSWRRDAWSLLGLDYVS